MSTDRTDKPLLWPSGTPVCLMAEENSDGKKTLKPWLSARQQDAPPTAAQRKPEFPDHVGPCVAADTAITPRTYLRVEVVDVEQRLIQIWTEHQPWSGLPAKSADASIGADACLECWGAPVGAGFTNTKHESVKGQKTGKFVFRYVELPPEPGEVGRKRIALRCCHGKFLKLVQGVLREAGDLLNEPGVALTVDEPLSRRVIEITEFRETTPVPTKPAFEYHATLVNPTSETLVKEFSRGHDQQVVGTWNNKVGVSLTIGVETTVSVKAEVPFFTEASGSVTTKWELKGEYQRDWGGSRADTERIDDKTTITVPPHTELSVRIVAERAQLDVPFLYTVHRWDLSDNQLPDSVGNEGVYSKVESQATRVYIEDVRPVSLTPAPA